LEVAVSASLELLDALFGKDNGENPSLGLPSGLEDWLAEVGHSGVATELLNFAAEPCHACNGTGEDGDYGNGDVGDVIVTIEGSDSLWVWCQQCLWHKQECLEGCGPVVVTDVFYL
jgi:hypothetical protein